MPLVLTHKDGSDYDDEPWEHYHFPNSYRRLIESRLGDWFVYYEPRRGNGRQAYVALGRLTRLWPDPHKADHFYVGVSDYEVFANAVSWRSDTSGQTLERELLNADGSTNLGRFQRAVRSINLAEFNTIVQLGFAGTLDEEPLALPMAADGDMAIVERRIVETVVQRKVRDRAFAKNVQSAYAQTCAFTGLRVVNGGGWTEMEAAHIRPVEHNGPDSVRNGLALSRTMHALFDRGFLSLTDEFQIIEARTAPLPEQIRGLLPNDHIARMPQDPGLRPHRSFLEFHRKAVFKDRAA